jgi:hypothetical protein
VPVFRPVTLRRLMADRKLLSRFGSTWVMGAEGVTSAPAICSWALVTVPYLFLLPSSYFYLKVPCSTRGPIQIRGDTGHPASELPASKSWCGWDPWRRRRGRGRRSSSTPTPESVRNTLLILIYHLDRFVCRGRLTDQCVSLGGGGGGGGGTDDAMAIFVALRSPELEVLGLTTTFGNVHTALATRNALHLVRAASSSPTPPRDRSRLPSIRQSLDGITFTSHTGSCVSAGGCGADRHPRRGGIPCNNQGSYYCSTLQLQGGTSR